MNDRTNSVTSAFAGALTSVVLPLHHMAEQVVIGTCTGILIWCGTRGISWLVGRVRAR